MTRISIVTVVFNDLEGLKRTHRSVSGQLGSSFDWVVCDGGSGDETTTFLETLGESVHWISEPDQGIYDAMNHGASMADGDYVVFMNAGDTFHDSGTLAKVGIKLSTHNEHPVDILFGGAILSFCDGRRMVYRAPKRVEDYLWHGLPANHQATYYRRKLLGTIPYDLQYQICGDYYLASTLLLRGARADYLDEPLAIFEVGGTSYQTRKQLFVEPYRIQRDVLGISFYCRLASMIKRFISTIGFVLLSQPFFLGKDRSGG